MKKTNPFRSAFAALLAITFLAPATLFAQQSEINSKIREEGMKNSKIMHIMHYFSDVYGPRLTGSPNHVAAAKWGAAEMKSWGFDNTFLEPWEFGKPGWVNERNTGMIVAPMQDTLTYEVLAWSPSTKGVVTAEAFHLVIPQFPAAENARIMQNPTQAELTAYFESIKSAVNGKMVLVGKPTVIDQSTPQVPNSIAEDLIKFLTDPTKTPAVY